MNKPTSQSQLQSAATTFLSDLRSIYLEARENNPEKVKTLKSAIATALIGLVLSIGGFSLFLGALTQSVSWVASSLGLGLIPSILIGFFVISVLVIGTGVVLLKKGKKRILNAL